MMTGLCEFLGGGGLLGCLGGGCGSLSLLDMILSTMVCPSSNPGLPLWSSTLVVRRVKLIGVE